MRSTDERMTVIKNRTNELKNEKKMRNGKILGLSYFVMSIGLLIVVANGMPGIMEQMGLKEYSETGAFASIFSSGSSVGYVIIALLAFALGICVTFLCIRLQRRTKEDRLNGRNN